MATTYKQAKEFLNNPVSSVNNVEQGYEYWVGILFKKTLRLFTYENLPPTLPSFEMEKVLIMKGMGAVVKAKSKLTGQYGLYAPFTGSPYNVDEYFKPRQYTFAQPYLEGKNYDDGKNCAIIYNDSISDHSNMLWKTIQRYARLLADLESSLYSQLINARGGRLGIAQNDKTAQAVDMVYRKLEYGDATTIVDPTIMVDTFKQLPIDITFDIQKFTELRDYLMNAFYNEIGMNSLEEKKERMVVGEIEADKEILHNNVEDMYLTRLNNVEWINHVFGTDIKVYKGVDLV